MTLHHGDCLDVMAAMEPESVDAIVTDPPYNLTADFQWGSLATSWGDKPRKSRGGGFMGKVWDGTGVAFQRETWEAAYRVAKPSAYLLAFGGTRTVHRMTVALEDAGWIIRDMLVWGYASGFPKSKASLKPAWEPIVMARKPGPLRMLAIDATRLPTGDPPTSPDGSDSSDAYSTWRIDPWHTDETRRHNPSTALMAWSAARPEAGSALLASVLASAFVGRGLRDYRADYPSCRRCGDGLVRIAEAADRDDAPLRPDVPGAPPLREWSASRIRESRCDDHRAIWDELARVVEEADALAYGNDTTSARPASRRDRFGGGAKGSSGFAAGYERGDGFVESTLGRWPANIVLTDPIFDGGIEGVVGGTDLDGTYSRFFLIPKANRSDREPVLGTCHVAFGGDLCVVHNVKHSPGEVTGPEHRAIAFGNNVCRNCGHGQFDGRRSGPCCDAPDYASGQVRARTNLHPTVKPTDLMRHLVRLVTPAGGTVLDPFLGSGTTALAAEMEGFSWIGIEREAEYVAIAEARLNGTQRGLGLSTEPEVA